MVGHVDDGRLAGLRVEGDAQIARLVQRTGDGRVELARIAGVAVRAGERQDQRGGRPAFQRHDLPRLLVESLAAAMQRIDLVVERQSIALAVQRRSEEHTSELQSLMRIPYAVFCL